MSYEVFGDAENGVDFQWLSGSLTIPAGSNSADIDVIALPDQVVEQSQTFNLRLMEGSDYSVGLKSERQVGGILYDDRTAPVGGTNLWNGTDLNDFDHFGGAFSTVNDVDEGEVIQAEISSVNGTPWSAQLKQSINSPVNQGDLILAEFKVRSVSGQGSLTAVFERAGTPFTKSLSRGISISGDWEKIQIPFISEESYAVGEASFGFFLATQIQIIRLTDLKSSTTDLQNRFPPNRVFS